MHYTNTILLAFHITFVIAQNLSESYTPIYVDCPKDVIHYTRSASQGLNPAEEIWLHERKEVAASALSEYLVRANMKEFDIDKYISGLNSSQFNAVPGIGLAVSGGGYASAIMGSGVIRALDGRENISNAAGTGGLLQAMSFVSGQSGGSWVTMSYAVAEFPVSENLLDYWQPQIDRFNAKTNGTHAATVESIFEDIAAKYRAGFNVSVADFLGRLNGYEFIEGPRGGLNRTMTGIQNLPKFEQHQMPMPIIQIVQVTDQDPDELGLRIPTLKTPTVCVPLALTSR